MQLRWLSSYHYCHHGELLVEVFRANNFIVIKVSGAVAGSIYSADNGHDDISTVTTDLPSMTVLSIL